MTEEENEMTGKEVLEISRDDFFELVIGAEGEATLKRVSMGLPEGARITGIVSKGSILDDTGRYGIAYERSR